MIASNFLVPSIGKIDPENIDKMVLSDINVIILESRFKGGHAFHVELRTEPTNKGVLLCGL